MSRPPSAAVTLAVRIVVILPPRWLFRRNAVEFVILDDDTDMGAPLPRLVRTETRVGLQPEHVASGGDVDGVMMGRLKGSRNAAKTKLNELGDRLSNGQVYVHL
jgi:hypothetical protein